MSSFYQVAVNLPITNSTLTYSSDGSTYESGQMVEVPLGRRKAMGVIIAPSKLSEINSVPKDKVKSIIGVMENSFVLSSDELSLYKWMSGYYHYSYGKLIFDCLPKLMKRPRSPEYKRGRGEQLPFELNSMQLNVYKGVSSVLDKGFSQHFAHGVTGSGKSLVYLSLIKDTLNSGKSAQFLLPEINLTPQFTQMFEAYLGHKVYAYHSGVTPSEKFNIWKSLKESDEPVLVLGVRSSIFLPIQNLGIVVVDEEHDQSFKQSDRCPYNGRDVAIKKAQLAGCPIILGSATPSFENYYNFSNSIANRNYYTLKERVSTGHLPKLEIYDTRKRFKENDPAWPLLDETIKDIENAIAKDEQVLVFINKLGFSSFVQCRSCGHQFKNEDCGCENNLRFFKQKNELSCSHCEFRMPLPDKCPDCGSITLVNKGFGTEKIAEVLKQIFPDLVIDRFDRDEITSTKKLNEKLEKFHSKKIDIMVGTQMLAKGHNFERVNLVVMLGIDSMMSFADFRATERTYQLACQVSGRAGRYSKESKVVIQSMNPDHPLFEIIASHSFTDFYEKETELRRLCYCPPFSRITMIYFSSRFRDKVIQTINRVATSLQGAAVKTFKDVRVLGPTPLSIEKKANQFTWAIMLKTDDVNQLHNMISTFENNYTTVSGVSYKIDVDPQHVL
jgi:primosomal protein N' (replication factor Y)